MISTTNKNIIKIAHLNAQSIKNMTTDIELMIKEEAIDILSINESWLKPNNKLKIPGFTITRKDRESGKGGGVLLCIRNSIPFTHVDLNSNPDLKSTHTEILTIKIHKILPNNDDLTISTYYNPPDTPLNTPLLQNIFDANPNHLLIGDLNSHSPYWLSPKTDQNGKSLETLLETNHLSLLNNEYPTYAPLHRPQYSSILDLAITSENLTPHTIKFETLQSPRSDHLPITISIQTNTIAWSQPLRKIAYIDLKKLKQITYEPATKILPLPLSTHDDLESCVLNLTKTIQDSVSTCTTEKILSPQCDFKTLPPHVLNQIKERRALHRKFLKTRDPVLKTVINKLTEQIRRETSKNKSTEWKKFCESLNPLKTSDGKLWRKLAAVTNRHDPKPPKTPTLMSNGSLIHSPNEISNIFATTLENVFQHHPNPLLNEKFKTSIDEQITSNYFDHDPHTIIPKTNNLEINYIIKNLRTKGAPGPDTITNKVLKSLPPIYHEILTRIINTSLRLSIIPQSWKAANVVMIPKPNKNHSLPENFRPISLLNTMSKILERVVQKRLTHWIDENHILSDTQCGFRKGRQTKDHILRLVQSVQQAFNKNEMTGVVFVDIEKAFDKIWHNGLLFKLKNKNIPPYLGAWIQNYLSGRTLRVKTQDSLSDPKQIKTGVPQGSVLGPNLFNLYFDDIQTNLTTTQNALYADDLAAWKSSPYLQIINKRLQTFVTNMQDWFCTWQLTPSGSKTVCILITHPSKRPKKLNLTLNGVQLINDPSPKFLGITLDPHLSFKNHAKYLKERASKRLNMMRCIKGKDWGASQKLLLTCYKTLIRPFFDYAPFPIMTMKPAEKLYTERIQRAAARIITHWPIKTNTKIIYEKLNLETIESRSFYTSKRYITKAAQTNPLIKDLISEYHKATEVYEGILSKHPKPTTLSYLIPMLTDSS